MECVTGRILKGKTPIVEGVEIWLARTTSGDGKPAWNGTFELPPGTHVDTGKRYRLELEDGRSGEVTVTNVGGPDDTTHTVGFQGTGPLQ